MSRKYIVFKKDGTLLTKEDVEDLQEKFSFGKMRGEGKNITLTLDVNGVPGYMAHSNKKTSLEFFGDANVTTKEIFETKYDLRLR